MIIVLILVAAFFLYHYSPVRAAGSAADRMLGSASELVKSLTEENIKMTFESKLLSVADTKGGLLEVAVLESVENFRREASSSFRGTTVTEASAQAVFKYHVPLREGWEIAIEESDEVTKCQVVAPVLQPSLPVAFKSDQLRTSSKEGWLRWDESEEKDALLAQITPELNKRASSNIESVREVARKTIKEFVHNWLLEQWSDERFSYVEVQFADEVETSAPGAEDMPESL